MFARRSNIRDEAQVSRRQFLGATSVAAFSWPAWANTQTLPRFSFLVVSDTHLGRGDNQEPHGNGKERHENSKRRKATSCCIWAISWTTVASPSMRCTETTDESFGSQFRLIRLTRV